MENQNSAERSIRGTDEAPTTTTNRHPYKEDCCLTEDRQCQEAIALMKHTADEAVVKEKMKLTLAYRQKLLHDPKESTDILSIFPRFLDIPGLIDQDFGLLFGDATTSKLLEKWSTNIKPKVIARSRGLTQTSELQDLIQNAEATEVEEDCVSRLGQRHVFHSDAGSPFASLKSRPQETGKDLS